MSWLDFAASVVKSVAWPAVAIVVLFVFRGQLRELFASLSELSVSKDGLKGKFDRKLKETRLEVEEVKVETAAQLPPDDRKLFDEKEGISRNVGRIVSAWKELEDVLRRRLKHGGSDSSRLSASALVQIAYDQNLITDVQRRSLLGLNTMRNLAVHGRADEIDNKRTEEFLALADAMKVVLDITAD